MQHHSNDELDSLSWEYNEFTEERNDEEISKDILSNEAKNSLEQD